MFVTVEGIEGCGKSTLISHLSQRLRSRGSAVLTTREPGGTPAGDAIRSLFLERALDLLPLSEAFLINAARAQHVVEAIEPALKSGQIVLCDRFVDSTLAYQGFGRGIDLDLLETICRTATDGLMPDITFLLDIPVAISRERVAARRLLPDRLESEDDEFHTRVRHGFLKLASSAPRYRVLDATKPPEDLAAQAFATVLQNVPR
ncbi:MAG: dTMP kinase [Candidatus Eremiobacteraeota bacterium]|nr:dTMP kinase [Candidatus Eremiobacteraeota bacterium]